MKTYPSYFHSFLLLFLLVGELLCSIEIANPVPDFQVGQNEDFSYLILSETFQTVGENAISLSITQNPAWISTETHILEIVGKHYRGKGWPSKMNIYKLKNDYIGFLCASRSGVKFYNLSEPTDPTLIGGIFTSPNYHLGKYNLTFTAKMYEDSTHGYLLYVVFSGGTGFEGLKIYDINDLKNPIELGGYYEGVTFTDVEKVNDDLVYMVDNTFIYLLDTTKKDKILLASTTPINSGQKLFYRADRYQLYLTDMSQGLKIFDVSDPSSPILKSQTYGSTSVRGFDFNKNMTVIYVCVKNDITILNNTLLDRPLLNPLPQYSKTGIGTSQDCNDVVVKDGIAYIANGNKGTVMMDVSNLTHPKVLSFDTSRIVKDFRDVKVLGDALYYIDKYFGLVVYNISNRTDPIYVTSRDVNVVGVDIKVQEDYAYVTDGSMGFKILDVSDVSLVHQVGNIDFLDKDVRELAIDGNYAYIVGFEWEFVQDDFAYVGTIEGLYVVDVAEKTDLEIRSFWNGTTKNVSGIRVKGDYAYIASNMDGLRIVNITNKTNPLEVGSFVGSGVTFSVDIFGDFAYLGKQISASSVLEIVNISNPANPSYVSEMVSPLQSDPPTLSLTCVGSKYVLFGMAGSGLAMVDVSDVGDPLIIYSQGEGDVIAIAYEGNLVFVLDSIFGLLIQDMNSVKIEGTPSECGDFDVTITAKGDYDESSDTFTIQVRNEEYADAACTLFFCEGILSNDDNRCSRHGDCYEGPPTIPFCTCDENYFGEICNVTTCFGVYSNVSDSSNLCYGNGECIWYDVCSCDEGFEGDECDRLEDDNDDDDDGFFTFENIMYMAGGGGLLAIIAASSVLLCCCFCFCFCCLILCFLCCVFFFLVCGGGGCVAVLFRKGYDDDVIDLDDVDGGPRLEIDKSLFEIDFDSIKLRKEIGSGGGGATVYLATWNDMACAVKLFRTSMLHEEEKGMYEEFEREVSIMGSISHPHLLRWYGCTLSKKRVGIVMEYCENGDLGHCIFKKKVNKLKDRIRISREISLGMGYLHNRNVIHRDLKPENVLLDRNLVSKIMDFGLSRVVDNSKVGMTKRIGTCFFMSPEIALGKKYTLKADVYSYSILVWCILFESIHPYGENMDFKVEFKVANDPEFRPPITEENEKNLEDEEIGWILEIVRKCWNAVPQERLSFDEISKIFKDKDI